MRANPFTLVVLLSVLSALAGRAAEPQSSMDSALPLTPEQKAKLQERNGLTQQAVHLLSQGKYREAVQPATKAMALTRAVYGEEHAEVALALARLAEFQVLADDFGEAVKTRKLVLVLQTKLDGEMHWRTVDARLALAFAEKIAGLAEAAHVQVVGALRQEPKAFQLYRQGKYQEAQGLELKVLEIYQTAVGPATAEVARGWHLVGLARFGNGDFKGGKEANEKALAIRRKLLPGDHPDLGRTINNLGKVEEALNHKERAKELFGEALRVWRRSLAATDPLIEMGLNNLGKLEYELREYANACKNLEEVLALRRKALPKDHPSLADSLHDLGVAQLALREYEGARKSSEEALSIRRKVLPKNHPNIANSLTNLGIVHSHLRDYEGARKSHEEALALRRRVLPKDHPDIAQSLTNLGIAQWYLREYEGARKSHEEALAMRRRVLPKHHLDIANSLDNLGVVQRELREYEEARKSHEEALAMRRRVLPKDHPDIAGSLTNLGAVQRELHEYEGARKSNEEALAIRRKSLPRDHPETALSLNNLGLVQLDLRDYEGAWKSYEEALAIQRKGLPKDHPDIALSLNNLGIVQGHLREYEGARKSFEEALVIFRKALPRDHPSIAHCLNNLGIEQHNLHEYEGARKSHEEALAIRRIALPRNHPDIAQSLNNLGTLQRYLGEYKNARKSHEEALAIRRIALPKDHPDIAESLNNLAFNWILSEKEPQGALTWLEEAFRIRHQNLSNLAIAQAETEQFRSAADAHFDLNLLISLGTLSGQRTADSTYAVVLGFKGVVTARQRWARRSRDLSDPATTNLLAQLRQTNLDILSSGGSRAKPAGPESQRRDEVADLEKLTERRARLERDLAAVSPSYRGFLQQGRIGPKELRAALPRETVVIDLVEYHHLIPPANGQTQASWEQRVAAFVIRPDQAHVALVPLGSSKDLTELIARWRSTYGTGKTPPEGMADPGVELRKRLWEPLAKHVGDAKVVLISPDGPLHGLPWAALPGAIEGTFLIHEHAFAILPVPQLLPDLLGEKARPAKEQPTLLLAGGIAFGDSQARDPAASADQLPPVPLFGPLAGTESEVNDLRTQFEDAYPDAPRPRILRKDRATKQAVLAEVPSHRFVHLATHGFFAAESEKSALAQARGAGLSREGLFLTKEAAGRHPGLLSGVVFAGVNEAGKRPEETILTALETSELGLEKVELVVLSACETGLGQVADGEGVLGLQRAFQLAGTRSVVASLWKVPDEETHQLMREFYKRVWSDKPVSKAEALRQAQLWMLENWKPRGGLQRPEAKGPPPPYVWAAFVLSGDWR